jgi:elongation factor Ts
MSINSGDVVKLRSLTGAGMMDCKNALEEANGDSEKAAEILRKKGIVKAAKRAEKVASEGLVLTKTDRNGGVILELNSETDFVAKNEDFKKLAEDLANNVLQTKSDNVETALKTTMNGISAQDAVSNLTAKIGEKISLRRFNFVEKTDKDVLGAYIHLGGKIGVLVVLENSNDEALAKDIAMHIAASNPKYLDRTIVSSVDMEKEKEVFTAQLKQQGKPDNIIENILKGKMEKYYEETCLVDQSYIKDESKKIKDLIVGNANIRGFIRYELGEGMEKKSADFLAEVNEQLV